MTGNTYDTLNLLNKITLQRFWNGIQLLTGFYFSKWLKKPYQLGLPVSISVEPTTSCNLRCPECPSGLRSFTRPTGMIKFDLFKKIIDEQHKHLTYLLLYFQGEPYLHKQFFELIQYARSKKIYTATSTNAHFLSEDNAKKTVESGLDRLIISIDGTTQDTYEQYRIGGDLEKVLEGTKNIIYWKKKYRSKKPFILFQYLVVGPNEHQIEDAKKLARDIGVDKIAFKTAQIYDYENGSSLIPTNSKFSRYRKSDNGKYTLKNKLLNQCWKMWHSCVITWDGQVVPCCFDKDASHSMGNVNESGFKDIWMNNNYYRFRSALLTSRKEIDICKNCTEGTKIWSD